MRKFYLAAALLVMMAPAHAQTGFSFDYNGKNIKIDIPKSCRDINCISVKMKDNDDEDAKDNAPAPSTPSPSATPNSSASTAPAAAPAAPAPVTAPSTATASAPAAKPAEEPLALPPPPARNDAPTVESNAAPVPAPAPAPQPAPATASAAPAPAPKPANAASSPVGVWLTEKKEGRVRIVECGRNLCGYEVAEKTNANGKQVLVDMHPTKANAWSGRINDTRDGSTYDSNITLRTADTLRVEGCAFGGLFCGGQTWKRVE